MFNFFKKRKPTLDEIFVTLTGLGFCFKNEYAKSKAIAELSDGSTNDVEIVLATMGNEQYDEEDFSPKDWLTDDVWHFDYEAIEDHGAYVSIVKNCSRISKGDLSFEGIKDFVDVEEEIAWIEFKTGKTKERFNLKIDNDWTDPMIFVELNRRLESKGSSKQLYQHDLGQDCLIICRTAEDVQNINKIANLKFRLLAA